MNSPTDRAITPPVLFASALAGTAFSVALALIRGGFTERGSLVLGLTTIIFAGAVCGAIVLPATTFLFLPRISLARALIGTMATGAGVLAFGFFSFDPAITALAAALGFGTGVWWLRRPALPADRA